MVRLRWEVIAATSRPSKRLFLADMLIDNTEGHNAAADDDVMILSQRKEDCVSRVSVPTRRVIHHSKESNNSTVMVSRD